jgi:hypothetical protein
MHRKTPTTIAATLLAGLADRSLIADSPIMFFFRQHSAIDKSFQYAILDGSMDGRDKEASTNDSDGD